MSWEDWAPLLALAMSLASLAVSLATAAGATRRTRAMARRRPGHYDVPARGGRRDSRRHR